MSGRLHEAAERLAEVARGMYDCEGLGGLQCAEVEAIANVLRAIDATDAADTIVTAHAQFDDDEDDVHHEQYLAIRAEHARIDAEIAAKRADPASMADEARAFREMPDSDYADVMNGRAKADDAVARQIAENIRTRHANCHPMGDGTAELLVVASREGIESVAAERRTVADLDGTPDAADWLTVGHVLDEYEVPYLRSLILP